MSNLYAHGFWVEPKPETNRERKKRIEKLTQERRLIANRALIHPNAEIKKTRGNIRKN